MPSLSVLILVAIATLLILRNINKFAKKRSGRALTGARPGSAGNAFCIHCGGPLEGAGEFCGSCGARRG